MTDHPMHLARYEHDVTCAVTETWCEAEGSRYNATWDADDVTCRGCLKAAIVHGDAARRRLNQIKRDAMTLHPVGADSGQA